MDVTNFICPVCKNPFNQEDDTVFCPECGTPHHRECWKKNGKCFNEALHGSQGIEETFKNPEATIEFPKQENPVNIEIKDEEKTGFPFSVEIKEPDLKINPSQTFLIDGKPSVLYEVAVRKNQKYYIPHFMAMSEMNRQTFSWNFWAFLVPLAWSIYRKMYKLSALIFAIYLLILGISGYYVFSNEGFVDATIACAEEDPNYIQNVSLYLSGGDVSLTVKQQKFIEEMQQLSVPGFVGTLSSVLLIGCRVFMGLRANTEYMKSIKKTIEKGERLGFIDDKLKMFIYRKRGIIPIVIPVIIGIFEWLTIY